MGHLLPIPQDGGDGSTDDPNAQLKLDLAAGRGRTLRSGSLKALSKKRGRKRERNPLEEKVRKLERENTRLEKELHKAHLIIDVQGKVAGLLGLSLEDGTHS